MTTQTTKPTTANRPKKARQSRQAPKKGKRHTITLQIPCGMTERQLNTACLFTWNMTIKGALNTLLWDMLDQCCFDHRHLVPEGFISSHDHLNN